MALFVHFALARTAVGDRDRKRRQASRPRECTRLEQVGRRTGDAQLVTAGTWSPAHHSGTGFPVLLAPPPRTELYLYDALLGSLIAQLELTDRTMRCTVNGTRGYAHWLAKRLEIPDLKERLEAGQQVTVFEFPHHECDIWLPEWGQRGAYFQVGQGDAPLWILFFSKPGDLWGRNTEDSWCVPTVA